MNFTMIKLSLLALFTAILLCAFVYSKDKVEKEPLSLLALLFALGAVLYIPVYFAQGFVGSIINKVFDIAGKVNLASGAIEWSSDSIMYIYYALCSFFAYALIAEVGKWLVLYFVTHKHKDFNCLFDGIVYSEFLAMGFALAMNIRYALVDGWDTFLLRLLDNVPGQFFLALLMGYFYTLWHAYSLADTAEEKLIAEGKLKGEKIRYPLAKLSLSVVVPLVTDAAYSFMRLCESRIVTVIYYSFVFICIIVCFVGTAKLAKKDATDSSFVNTLLKKYHPEYSGAVFVDEEYLGLDDVGDESTAKTETEISSTEGKAFDSVEGKNE